LQKHAGRRTPGRRAHPGGHQPMTTPLLLNDYRYPA
jgi:hypothetical protein